MRFPIEQKVLDRIRPGKELPDIVRRTLDKISQALEGKAVVSLGGSTAKGTHLAEDHDYDVFIRFEKDKVDINKISDELEHTLSQLFNGIVRVHGSRDYFHLDLDEYFFEFIPVLHVNSPEEAENVTDMSPLHVEYVISKINPELADEVRLLKQFCKSVKVYGAESYIGGFSGYMVELLVIHYGSFQKSLEAAAEWEDKVVIDTQEHHEDPSRALNKAKLQSPLIMVDPVQPDRNAAAALSENSFNVFKEKSAEYLSVPEEAQESFFEIQSLDIDSFKKTHKDANTIRMNVVAVHGKPDVSGAKCFKAFQFILRELQRNDFLVHASDWEYKDEKAIFLFAIDKEELEKERVCVGPPLNMKEHVESFKAEHNNTYEEEGRVFAREVREFTKALNLLEFLCKHKYVLDRVEKAEVEQ